MPKKPDTAWLKGYSYSQLVQMKRHNDQLCRELRAQLDDAEKTQREIVAGITEHVQTKKG